MWESGDIDGGGYFLGFEVEEELSMGLPLRKSGGRQVKCV
jgi:hypothetical protein